MSTYEDEEEEFTALPQEDTDLARVVKQLFDVEGIEGKSILSKDERKTVVILLQLHKDFPWRGFDSLARLFLHTALSVEGKSRTQMVEIARGNVQIQPKEPGGRAF